MMVVLKLTHAQSAFSTRLGDLGHVSYEILAPDLVHEFELGVWKKIFEHLLRLLHKQGPAKVQEFNRRCERSLLASASHSYFHPTECERCRGGDATAYASSLTTPLYASGGLYETYLQVRSITRANRCHLLTLSIGDHACLRRAAAPRGRQDDRS